MNKQMVVPRDIQEELAMSYDMYVKYLIQKYGPAEYDYFCTEQCKSKNKKISRTKEGLFCHHIDENKEILLSTPEVARIRPFAYQKADRLVYANYLEHLLLHIKIVEDDVENKGLGLGGVLMICGAINDYYRHGRADGWRKNAMAHLDEKQEDYIQAMLHFKDMVERDPVLKKLLPSPVLAQGWYGKINQKVHKELYGYAADWNVEWSNQDVLNYLEEQHKVG